MVLGITFKENCPDVRNTKAVDVINNLSSYSAKIDVFDPWASTEEVLHEYNLITYTQLPKKTYDGIVLTVAHNQFLSLDLNSLLRTNGIVYDVKGVLGGNINGRL